MAELVDALDSKSSSARSAGSIPARGTISLHQTDLLIVRMRIAHLAKPELVLNVSENLNEQAYAMAVFDERFLIMSGANEVRQSFQERIFLTFLMVWKLSFHEYQSVHY